MSKKNKFLVIGSNSFTGSHFIDFLINKNIECFGVSRSAESQIEFLPYKRNKNVNKNFKFKQIDLNKDIDSLVKIIEEEKFSHIVNFAAQSMVGQSWINPEDWYQTNIVSLSKFVNLIKNYKFIDGYVSVTTPEVYGSNQGWIKENFNLNPSTPYAISRAAQDMHLKAMYESFDFPVKFTRAANVYGPGQRLYRIIPRTIIEALNGGELILDGGGKSERVFIHAQDVADATFKIAIDGKKGDSYHISGDKSLSIKKLVELICGIVDSDFNELVRLGPERLGKDDSYLLDSSKIINELKWKETFSLEDGLIDTCSWVKDNLKSLNKYSKEYKHKK